MKAIDLVHRKARICFGDSSLAEAATMMLQNDVGALPVVESMTGKLCGLITDRDIAMGALTQGLPLDRIPVRSVCSRNVHFCRPEEDLGEVLLKMRMYALRRLPVLGPDEHVLGVVTLDDIASAALAVEGPTRLALDHELAETYGAVTRPHVRS
ncbi:MAG: CBS domain-containing protein [Planctomycetes bacterium]|nr:CBS domain-containing protein [Planctomycetota bacterium]